MQGKVLRNMYHGMAGIGILLTTAPRCTKHNSNALHVLFRNAENNSEICAVIY